jgi:hypothetical protein
MHMHVGVTRECGDPIRDEKQGCGGLRAWRCLGLHGDEFEALRWRLFNIVVVDIKVSDLI